MSLGVPRAKCRIPSCAVSPWLGTSLVLSLSLVTAVCPGRLEGKKSVSGLAGVSKVEDEIQGCSGTFLGCVLCQFQAVEGGWAVLPLGRSVSSTVLRGGRFRCVKCW